MRRSCYTEKAPNAWQRRGTQNTRNTYNQPNRPNRQTSQTKHQALPKGQPGRRITPIHTAAVHASALQQPTISTHTRQGHHQIFQPTQPAAKLRSSTGGLVEQAGWLRRRAEPHNTIDTTRLSGDAQRPPAPASGGPSSGVADGQPRAHSVLLSKGRGVFSVYVVDGAHVSHTFEVAANRITSTPLILDIR